MLDGTRTEAKGLFATLGDLIQTLVSVVHTRLDLLSLDLEEDRDHLVTLTLTALAAAFSLGIGIVLTVLLLVVLFWDTHRIMLLGLLATTFLSAGVAASVRVKRLSKVKPRLFASSLAELLKDRRQLATS